MDRDEAYEEILAIAREAVENMGYELAHSEVPREEHRALIRRAFEEALAEG